MPGWNAQWVATAGLLGCSVIPSAAGAAELKFRRGDVNNDARVSIADPIALGLAIFLDGPPPPCQPAADFDGDGRLDVADCIALLDHLFGVFPSLPPPPECVAASSDLPCDTAPACNGAVPPIPGRFTLFVATSPLAEEPPPRVAQFVGLVGQQLEIPFFVFLKGETERGVEASGWSLGIAIEEETGSASLAGVSLKGTAVEAIVEGGGDGLHFWTARRASDLSGWWSAVALDLTTPKSLAEDRGRSAHLILRGTIQATVPSGGIDGAITLRPVGSLPAGGGPVALEVAAANQAFSPEPFPLRVRLLHGDPFEFFLRGDSNQDGRHDISDPTFTLNSLFLGGPPSECPDATDANDDGTLDISDGISSLSCLFLGKPCPPPYPRCGLDDPGDDLPCDVLGLNCR